MNDGPLIPPSRSTPDFKLKTKLEAELNLILSRFCLDVENVIRLRNGEIAEGTIETSGYRRVRAGSKMLLLHRVKFALYNGWLPERIDHKDGDRTNNKIGNLRPCTPSQNAANASYSNRPMPVSGLRNVYLMPNGKYKGRAQLGERRQ